MDEHLKKWIEAVNSGIAERVRDVVEEHPGLRAQVNDQVFPFDSSAVFQGHFHGGCTRRFNHSTGVHCG